MDNASAGVSAGVLGTGAKLYSRTAFKELFDKLSVAVMYKDLVPARAVDELFGWQARLSVIGTQSSYRFALYENVEGLGMMLTEAGLLCCVTAHNMRVLKAEWEQEQARIDEEDRLYAERELAGATGSDNI